MMWGWGAEGCRVGLGTLKDSFAWFPKEQEHDSIWQWEEGGCGRRSHPSRGPAKAWSPPAREASPGPGGPQGSGPLGLSATVSRSRGLGRRVRSEIGHWGLLSSPDPVPFRQGRSAVDLKFTCKSVEKKFQKITYKEPLQVNNKKGK